MHTLPLDEAPLRWRVTKQHLGHFPTQDSAMSSHFRLWSSNLARQMALLGLGLLAMLSGCVVNNGDSRGILAVSWQPSTGSCAVLGATTVRITLRQNGTLIREVSGLLCENRQAEITVPEGRYTLQIRGYTGTGIEVAQTPATTVEVIGGLRSPTGQLLLGPGAVDAGAIAVAWTIDGLSPANGCASRGLQNIVVSAIDDQQQAFLTSVSVPCTDGQATLVNVPAGTRWLQIDGFAANDAPTSPSYGNASIFGPVSVFAGQTTAISGPVDLVKLGGTQPTGKGNVRVSWTVLGQAAASACAAQGLTSVDVRLLSGDGSRKDIAHTVVNCNVGTADLNDIAAGSYYVQIDGIGPAAPAAWGNINLTGPITVSSGQRTIGNKAVDIGRRTVISLDWQYSDGGTCGSHGHGDVYVELRDGTDKVIVPMNDPYAVKYCDLTTADGYVDRVVDMGFLEPQCALPPGAKGLVVCNITGNNIGVTLSATASGSKNATYGGAMKIQQIVAGTHTVLPTPLLLKPCGAGTQCTQP